MSETVDARGLSCPQPVMLARRAMEAAGKGEIVVLVDSQTQVGNIERTAGHLGWQCAVAKIGGDFELRLTR